MKSITVQVEITVSQDLVDEARETGDTVEEAVESLLEVKFPQQFGSIEDVTAW